MRDTWEIPESRILVQETPSAFIRTHNETLSAGRLLYSQANGSPQYEALRIAKM
jgi:hypothetical protein